MFFAIFIYILINERRCGMNFKENVESTIKNAGPGVDRKELLIDIFKTTIAQFFEWYLVNKSNGNRLPFEAVVQAKQQLINEFRGLSIDQQQSVEWYENLFESTVKEIFNDAALAHRGTDRFEYANQNFEVNKDMYQQSTGGIYIPK
jgi:hypothetical protein